MSCAWSDNGQLIQNVDGCGTLNTSNAVYTLNQSIYNVSGICLNILADGIILNGEGFDLTGDFISNSNIGISVWNITGGGGGCDSF
jgi:hypothetical protein